MIFAPNSTPMVCAEPRLNVLFRNECSRQLLPGKNQREL